MSGHTSRVSATPRLHECEHGYIGHCPIQLPAGGDAPVAVKETLPAVRMIFRDPFGSSVKSVDHEAGLTPRRFTACRRLMALRGYRLASVLVLDQPRAA